MRNVYPDPRLGPAPRFRCPVCLCTATPSHRVDSTECREDRAERDRSRRS